MPPKSKKSRFAEWYAEPGNAAKHNERRIVAAIRNGRVPQDDSLKRYNISFERMNCLRKEGGVW